MQVKPQCFRYHDPASAGYHAIQKVGASNTGTKRTQCTIRTGMRVSAENQLAGFDIVFKHDLMADTAALIHFDIILACKFPHLFMYSCRLRVFSRDIMVDDKDNLSGVGDMRVFEFIPVHIDCQMGGAVVAHQPVKVDRMNLARFYLAYIGGACNNFFRNGHAHDLLHPLLVIGKRASQDAL